MVVGYRGVGVARGGFNVGLDAPDPLRLAVGRRGCSAVAELLLSADTHLPGSFAPLCPLYAPKSV